MNEDCLLSISKIRKEIESRDLATKIFNDNNIDVDNLRLNSKNKYYLPTEKGFSSLKAESPFKIYFDVKCQNYENKCDLLKNCKKNRFFCPDLLKIIYDLLYILPLWSGLMIANWQNAYPNFQMPSRLTNNSVENYFNIVKNGLLKKKKTMPSIISSLFYNRLQMKFFQFYQTTKLTDYKKANDINVENWSKNKPNIKREKGYYYSAIQNYASAIDFETQMKSLINIDLDNIFCQGSFYFNFYYFLYKNCIFWF
jgi:hypothetical protein